MSRERGAAHRTREMEGREDARAARGKSRAPLSAREDACVSDRSPGALA